MERRYYDAAHNEELSAQILECRKKLFTLNHTPPDELTTQQQLIREIVGKSGAEFNIVPPFFCDYGYNIELGERFFANAYLTILDEEKVSFGADVFIGPNCGFYTAGHPESEELRNKGLEYALPISVGDSVWFGAQVCVLPGVSIGSNTIIGAGSVVTRDIPGGVLAAGNPCRVIRPLHPEHDLPPDAFIHKPDSLR